MLNSLVVINHASLLSDGCMWTEFQLILIGLKEFSPGTGHIPADPYQDTLHFTGPILISLCIPETVFLLKHGEIIIAITLKRRKEVS